MMNLTHKAAEVFANDLYATQATGVRFVEVGEDYAKCTLDIQPIHRNAMGGVMGGVLFTLSVDKLISLYGSHHINISTYQHINKTHSTNSSIHYLSQPKGNTLTAETQSIKTGRNSCVFNINLYDGNQTLITIVTTEGRRVSIV